VEGEEFEEQLERQKLSVDKSIRENSKYLEKEVYQLEGKLLNIQKKGKWRNISDKIRKM
jgi:hypothetical protein